ncbi:hypothetical protein [Ensifer adhaerens]|uniref:hypothetical protein n=1 Tax=Ensifer adhaerens TaxID=106592 RepID=UPI001F2804D9|nr:hypothetical protein [Ensifer adhaerens]
MAIVLFPHPLPPTIAWISPARAEKEAPSKARVGPKYFFTPRTTTVSRDAIWVVSVAEDVMIHPVR